jgi:seryl-tRNA synthetase
MNKPEALRLADELRAAPERSRTSFEAAAELRRLYEENERLVGEVARRNSSALQGQEAVAALVHVHEHYEGLEAQRDALLEALKNVTVHLPPSGAAKVRDLVRLIEQAHGIKERV